MTGISLLDVAFCVVHDYPGGAMSLAPRMMKAGSTLAQELSNRNGAKLGLLDAERITLLTGDLRILQAMANNAGQMLLPIPDANPAADDAVLRAIADAVAQFGALVQEVGTDVADGKVTANELKRIDAQAASLMSALHSLRDLLGRMHAEGRAA